MDIKDAKYMLMGKTVCEDSSGDLYYLVQDANDETNKVLAVKLDDLRRYNLLKAWLTNGIAKKAGKVSEYESEKAQLAVTIDLSHFSPANKIRFITPNYRTMFEVFDLGYVNINGEKRRVNWLDDYHFQFVEPTGYGFCYHICEFAELSERHYASVSEIA